MRTTKVSQLNELNKLLQETKKMKDKKLKKMALTKLMALIKKLMKKRVGRKRQPKEPKEGKEKKPTKAELEAELVRLANEKNREQAKLGLPGSTTYNQNIANKLDVTRGLAGAKSYYAPINPEAKAEEEKRTAETKKELEEQKGDIREIRQFLLKDKPVQKEGEAKVEEIKEEKPKRIEQPKRLAITTPPIRKPTAKTTRRITFQRKPMIREVEEPIEEDKKITISKQILEKAQETEQTVMERLAKLEKEKEKWKPYKPSRVGVREVRPVEYKCPHCNRYFTDIEKHIREIHIKPKVVEKKERKVEKPRIDKRDCKYCPEKGFTRLDVHMRQKHPKEFASGEWIDDDEEPRDDIFDR